MTGIEPALKAWEALILPLNYTCANGEFLTTENLYIRWLRKASVFFVMWIKKGTGGLNGVKNACNCSEYGLCLKKKFN